MSTIKPIVRFFGKSISNIARAQTAEREETSAMKTFCLLVLPILILSSGVTAQTRKPGTIAELAAYRGADREQLLYAGAKNEGKIIWYTSLAGDSYKEIVKAFETKYAGVKVESYRAAGAELVVRLEE